MLSTADRTANFEIVHGDGAYREPYFSERVMADIDADGHIIACCADCNDTVRFDVEHDGDYDGERWHGYTTFHAVDRKKIEVFEDSVRCSACLKVAA